MHHHHRLTLLHVGSLLPSSKQSMQQACLPVSWNNKPLPFFAVALIFLRSFQLSAQRARARSMRTPLHKRRTGESQTATRGPSSLCHGARGSPPSACAREARLQPLAPPPQFPQTMVGLSELAPRRCSQLQLPRSLATRPEAQDLVHPNSHQARRRQASRCRRHHARSRRKRLDYRTERTWSARGPPGEGLRHVACTLCHGGSDLQW